MKLTLQLVAVALTLCNVPTKFRNNLFKFILYKVGDTRSHLRRHALTKFELQQKINMPES